ncbi:MAG: hypothetical protein MHM6MM_007384 [Cercozoa sp. M6MM]
MCSLRPLKKDVNKIQSDLHTLRSDVKSDVTKIQSDVKRGFDVSKIERQHELGQLKSELQRLFFEQKIDDVRQQACARAVTPATDKAADEIDPSHTKPE